MGNNNTTPRKRTPARGDLCINIRASKELNEASVDNSGYIQEGINEKDRKIFKITDGRLKEAIMKKHKRFPNDVFVRSPTPWGDIYSMYNWDDITRILKVAGAEVVSVNSERIVVATRRIVNDSDAKGRFTTDINQQNQNTVTTTWTKDEELTIGLKIEYKILVPESPEISFESSWGEDTYQTFVSETKYTVDAELEPGQEVDAYLYVNRCVMKVKVTYESNLLGNVACHFDEGIKYSYWRFRIDAVQKAGELPTKLTSTEVLEIIFYTDGEITLSKL